MHEGAVCREIMDIVSEAAIENDIQKIYEIVISVGPYSCLHEGQLNFYFDVMKKLSSMDTPIKTFGTYKIKAKLFNEVSATITVQVVED